MKEEFQFLLELQEIDKVIQETLDRQKRIPQEIISLQEEFGTQERLLEEDKEGLRETEKRKRGLETDLATLTESLKKHQAQLHTIKTNKEYTALLHEIEEEKKKISSVEEDILILIDEIEEGDERVGEKEKMVEGERLGTEENGRTLEMEKSTLEESLQKREVKRKQLLEKMDGSLLTQYERLRKGRDGFAIVAIQGPVCEGCYTALPPQVAVEIRKGEKLKICENCGRILVWKEN